MFRDCLAFLSQADIIVLEPGSAATRPPGSGTRWPRHMCGLGRDLALGRAWRPRWRSELETELLLCYF